MLRKSREIHNLEIVSDDISLNDTSPEKIYEDTSTLSVEDKIISSLRLDRNFMASMLVFILVAFIFITISAMVITEYPIIAVLSFIVNLFLLFYFVFSLSDKTLNNGGVHGSYYLITKDRIIEIPSNTNSMGKEIRLKDLHNIIIEDSKMEVQTYKNEIEFQLPNKKESIEMHKFIYGLQES